MLCWCVAVHWVRFDGFWWYVLLRDVIADHATIIQKHTCAGKLLGCKLVVCPVCRVMDSRAMQTGCWYGIVCDVYATREYLDRRYTLQSGVLCFYRILVFDAPARNQTKPKINCTVQCSKEPDRQTAPINLCVSVSVKTFALIQLPDIRLKYLHLLADAEMERWNFENGNGMHEHTDSAFGHLHIAIPVAQAKKDRPGTHFPVIINKQMRTDVYLSSLMNTWPNYESFMNSFWFRFIRFTLLFGFFLLFARQVYVCVRWWTSGWQFGRTMLLLA